MKRIIIINLIFNLFFFVTNLKKKYHTYHSIPLLEFYILRNRYFYALFKNKISFGVYLEIYEDMKMGV
ncbi:hypothetical protein BpHYR1_038675 [Brachionus plicatilis]|uniref:Uncharacterized protein n=1 Tax=Brachionus plicatilis TaxID=10195 RepID=A0A3M7Q593_BRAPC|nr:hypothetical protein BpHYR1_038675 [Brachionus plicatilis]